MTQEEKQLLLKDLCARLPYEAHVYIEFENGNILDDTVLNAQYIHDWMAVPSCQNMAIKPYLRPMSSMTEEEKADLEEYSKQELDKYADAVLDCADKDTVRYAQVALIYKDIDWYTKKHFDYRGLIPMGLALEAPEGMYK